MPKVDRQAFAERVNALREARGMSWKQLAARVGSTAALRNWKRGRSWPRTETIVALSEALGVTTDYLLTGTGPVLSEPGSSPSKKPSRPPRGLSAKPLPTRSSGSEASPTIRAGRIPMPESRGPAFPNLEAPTSEAFRDTFLFVFEPEDAQVFRQFVEVLQDRLLDRSTYAERYPQFSYTLAEMFAVKADLCFLATFLRAVGTERHLSDLTPTEVGLSELAERLAPEVAALAERLEHEVQSLISDDDGDEQRRGTDPGE
jgi:transcriptional regulator with XRE-family HTH domain